MKKQGVLSVIFMLCFMFQGFQEVKGQGVKAALVSEDTFVLDPFHGIALGINAQVFLQMGTSSRVIVRSKDPLAKQLSRKVENGIWNIEFDQKLNFTDSLQVFVTVPAFKSIAVGGSGSISCVDSFSLKELLSVSLGGSGVVLLKGDAPQLQINVAGSGRVDAQYFQTPDAQVHLAGSGEVRVWAVQNLEVSVAGNGAVRYRGAPSVKSTIVGNGVVKPIN